MNLEALRAKIVSQVKEHAGYRLAKLGAMDGLKVNALLSSLEMEGDGDTKKVKSAEDLVRLYALLLSKAIVNESGEKTLDSDEGRELLTRLPRQEFLAVGDAAMEWNVGEQKKS